MDDAEKPNELDCFEVLRVALKAGKNIYINCIQSVSCQFDVYVEYYHQLTLNRASSDIGSMSK